MSGRSRSGPDLKASVIDESVPLSTALRQAKVLAYELGHEPLKAWVGHELNGYPEDSELPPYRRLDALNFGTFVSSRGDRISNQILPVSYLPDEEASALATLRIGNSVRELEGIAAGDEGELRRPWPAEAVALAGKYIKMSEHWKLFEAWQPLPRHSVQGILDAVRNRLLDFVLELQEIEPKVLSSPDAAQGIQTEQVNQIFNVTINSPGNVVAVGKDFSQTIGHTVKTGDITSLRGEMKRLGVPDQDVEELVAAVQEDGKPQEKQLGTRVRAWLGRMTERAGTGAWKTATTAAPQLVVKALSDYFGWG